MSIARFLTTHATQRCQQRGIRQSAVLQVLVHSDIASATGHGATLCRVSADMARRLNLRDRLVRYAVLLSEDGQIITVGHIHRTKRGGSWRRSRWQGGRS